MKKNLFIYLQYWNIKSHIHERYRKDFTKKQCKIVLLGFEEGLKSYNKKELKKLSQEILITKTKLKLSLEELNKRYRNKLRKERNQLIYIFLSIIDNISAFLKNITNMLK